MDWYSCVERSGPMPQPGILASNTSSLGLLCVESQDPDAVAGNDVTVMPTAAEDAKYGRESFKVTSSVPTSQALQPKISALSPLSGAPLATEALRGTGGLQARLMWLVVPEKRRLQSTTSRQMSPVGVSEATAPTRDRRGALRGDNQRRTLGNVSPSKTSSNSCFPGSLPGEPSDFMTSSSLPARSSSFSSRSALEMCCAVSSKSFLPSLLHYESTGNPQFTSLRQASSVAVSHSFASSSQLSRDVGGLIMGDPCEGWKDGEETLWPRVEHASPDKTTHKKVLSTRITSAFPSDALSDIPPDTRRGASSDTRSDVQLSAPSETSDDAVDAAFASQLSTQDGSRDAETSQSASCRTDPSHSTLFRYWIRRREDNPARFSNVMGSTTRSAIAPWKFPYPFVMLRDPGYSFYQPPADTPLSTGNNSSEKQGTGVGLFCASQWEASLKTLANLGEDRSFDTWWSHLSTATISSIPVYQILGLEMILHIAQTNNWRSPSQLVYSIPLKEIGFQWFSAVALQAAMSNPFAVVNSYERKPTSTPISGGCLGYSAGAKNPFRSTSPFYCLLMESRRYRDEFDVVRTGEMYPSLLEVTLRDIAHLAHLRHKPVTLVLSHLLNFTVIYAFPAGTFDKTTVRPPGSSDRHGSSIASPVEDVRQTNAARNHLLPLKSKTHPQKSSKLSFSSRIACCTRSDVRAPRKSTRLTNTTLTKDKEEPSSTLPVTCFGVFEPVPPLTVLDGSGSTPCWTFFDSLSACDTYVSRVIDATLSDVGTLVPLHALVLVQRTMPSSTQQHCEASVVQASQNNIEEKPNTSRQGPICEASEFLAGCPPTIEKTLQGDALKMPSNSSHDSGLWFHWEPRDIALRTSEDLHVSISSTSLDSAVYRCCPERIHISPRGLHLCYNTHCNAKPLKREATVEDYTHFNSDEFPGRAFLMNNLPSNGQLTQSSAVPQHCALPTVSLDSAFVSAYSRVSFRLSCRAQSELTHEFCPIAPRYAANQTSCLVKAGASGSKS